MPGDFGLRIKDRSGDGGDAIHQLQEKLESVGATIVHEYVHGAILLEPHYDGEYDVQNQQPLTDEAVTKVKEIVEALGFDILRSWQSD